MSLSDSIPGDIILRDGRQQAVQEEKSLVIIQFNEIPDEAGQMRLKQSGIELLEYVPDNAYTATIVGQIDWEALKAIGVRAVFKPGAEDIVETLLLAGIVPEHARTVAGKIDVTLSFARSFTWDEVVSDINQIGFELLSDALKSHQILDVRIPEGSIRRLAEFPWVQFIEPVPGPTEMLNDKSTANTKANVLASTAILGYKLTGEGVVIGLGDFSDPIVHPDIGRRVISYVDPNYSFWHGIHVGGTAAGSGLLNEKYRGYAPGSKIVSKSTSQIWENSSQYVQQYGMVVTSNTYGGPGGCGGYGGYSNTSSALDQQAFQFPSLLHVFAAGNSGLSTNCNVLPVGFGTVLGGYQSAKNVLTVGNTQTNGIISPTSSKGPVEDGRIKPEVAAPGNGIISAIQGNAYQSASGTSMATPAVTGGAALLYQRYRQLHQQNNPKNALIKALICNGATDQGLPGPDYSYGFGQMNLLRSVTMLDKGHYFNGTIAHLATKNHEIVVPANTAKLKVLIYWHDPAPSPLADGGTLVNNLDMSMIRPGNTKVLPKFPSATAPTAAAVSGVDSVNNIEQIVLDAPAAGTYSVQVVATKIPLDVQEYFVVYDIIETSVTVTYPLAGDHLTKGDAINICWDAYGDELSTYNVAYSLNDGAAWTTLNAGVAPDQRQLAWTVPDAMTSKAKVRVTRNGGGLTNVSGPFAILGIPVVTLQSVQCEGYIALQWSAVSGASDYEVMLSTGDEMKAVGITNGLNYTAAGLSQDSIYYMSVRARKDQVPGRRSIAIIRKPDSGTCQGAISDNDLKMEAVVTPLPNVRMFTKAAYAAEQSVTISIKNIDDQPQSQPIEVGYSLGGEMHWESVNTTLAPSASTNYTFERRVNLASASEATLLVRVRLAGDPVKSNDSLVVKLRQIPNPKITLPYVLNPEALPAFDVRASIQGIQGAVAYDFKRLQGNGRLRTKVPPITDYLPENTFVLDATDRSSFSSQSYLEGTFNLSGYRVHDDDVRLNFKHTYWAGYYDYDFNRVYIRGSSDDPWILAYIIDGGPYGDVENSYKVASVEVTQLLRNNSQEFSAGFQVRWASAAVDAFPEDGYAIHDIRLFKTRSDVEALTLNVPPFSICDNLGGYNMQAVFKNNGSDDCFNVPVKLSVDGIISEHNIDVIRKSESATFTVYDPGDIYKEGKHVLKVWCEKGSDFNRTNDTLEVEIFTPGVVTAMPYLENFESGNGGWYTLGTNSSWQFGKPSSAGISNAASGQNAWKTNLTGFYHNNEESYLYSPCFNLPYSYSTYLSFSARMDMESCDGDDCDMVYIECDSGYGWRRLGAKGYGTNWYGDEKGGLGFWSGKVAGGWRVFTALLPTTNYLRIRFVFKSNGAGNGEGVAIDDIHIYNMGYDIYSGGSVPSGIGSVYMPGNEWSHYSIDNGLVASIHSRGQDITSVLVKPYLNEGPLQLSEGQLVLDRNFVINSDRNFEKPVGVRLYIPEASIERLVKATGYPGVNKPTSVYDLAVTKYSGPNQDGNMTNDTKEGWDYYPHDKVAKVPFGSGYYLEFETKNFSEFWLAKSYIGTGIPLPVELINFTAQKSGSGEGALVYLNWSTASETDFSHFVVQVAVGSENVKKGLFYDLGTIAGKGMNENRQYTFLDNQAARHGVHYYRLKMVDRASDGTEGSFTYSSIKSVSFDQIPEWHVFPNPSKGMFRLEPKSVISGPVLIEVIDLDGITRKKLEFGEGTPALEVDLRSPDLADGFYVIKVKSKEGERRFKVVKE